MCLYSGEPNYNTSTSSAASRLTGQRGRGIVGQGIMVIMVNTRQSVSKQNKTISNFMYSCVNYTTIKILLLMDLSTGFMLIHRRQMLSSWKDNQKSLLKQSLSESEQKFQFGGNAARPCQMSILTFSTNSICQPGLRNYRKNPCSPRLTDPAQSSSILTLIFWESQYYRIIIYYSLPLYKATALQWREIGEL